MNNTAKVKVQLKKVQAKLGMTLVELLMVITLLAISVGISADILVTLLRSYNKTQVANEIEQQASFAVSKLEKQLRNAVEASSDGQSVTLTDKSGDIHKYSIARDGTYNYDYLLYTYRFGQTGATSSKLTTRTSDAIAGGVVISAYSFSVAGSNPTSISYSITFDSPQQNIAGLRGVFGGTVTLSNTIVVRNTY